MCVYVRFIVTFLVIMILCAIFIRLRYINDNLDVPLFIPGFHSVNYCTQCSIGLHYLYVLLCMAKNNTGQKYKSYIVGGIFAIKKVCICLHK